MGRTTVRHPYPAPAADEVGHAFAAVHPEGGRNVFVTGRTCTRCDRTLDPHYRHGVPCYQARAHAELTVRSYWGRGHVERIPVGDLPPDLRP
ncbi:hypothetical protein ACFFR3_46080 [Nonomuraea salmonea]|uniref:Uncharacterized protein n=1 Tax=Nonomuraea salmonea TaxID=46181 RepID=A0ABV5P2V4_9ACTN